MEKQAQRELKGAEEGHSAGAERSHPIKPNTRILGISAHKYSFCPVTKVKMLLAQNYNSFSSCSLIFRPNFMFLVYFKI